MAHPPRKGDDLGATIGGGKESLEARTELARWREEEYIVLFACGRGVVVEVVHDKAGAVSGKGNVELAEEADNGAGCGGVGGEGEEDVPAGVDELKEDTGSQVRAEACGCGSA
jgi:hypothetical protein